MRHHILFALTGLLAAATSTFAHTASSSDPHLESLLIKRSGNNNGGGYSYCARSSDKLVYKNGQCACKFSVPSSSWTKCNGPKTASLGKAVCGERGCNILCDDDDMVVSNGDCTCKSGYTLSGSKCIKSCGQYEAYHAGSKSCVCAPSCSRNSRHNNRCEPSCGENEEYRFSSCQCKAGFEKKAQNGRCKPICKGDHEIINGNSCKCEDGYKYDSNGKCKAICKGDNEYFNKNSNQCKCIDGFSKQNNKCKPICTGENEYYHNGQCKCIDGCSRGGKDNKCKPICKGDHEIVGQNNKCKCKDGFEYNNKGVCKPKTPSCPDFMEWNGFKCTCKPGCNPHGNGCTPPQCRTNEEYNQILKKCVCKPNFDRTLWGFCVPSHPTCPKKNEFWNGTKCVCKPGCWRNREQDDCEPNTPSHKPVPEVIKKKMASRQVPVWSSKHHTREQDSAFCPDSLSACPIPSLQGGYECVDTTQELENCGGCTVDGAGMDCTSIAGVSGVGCLSGQCVVFSCTEGYRLSSAGACVPSLLGRSA